MTDDDELDSLTSIALFLPITYGEQLSQDETYADIAPVRLVNSTAEAVSAFISIMRGCNNM